MYQQRTHLRKRLQWDAARYLVIIVSVAHFAHCETGGEDAVLDTVRNLVKNSSESKFHI